MTTCELKANQSRKSDVPTYLVPATISLHHTYRFHLRQHQPFVSRTRRLSPLAITMSVNENSETVFSLLHAEMEKKYESDTPESIAEAEGIAHKLLLHPQLPPYYLMRAHLILATGDTNYLFHAQQAVQICEMGIEISNESVAGKTGADNVEQELLDEAF